MHTQNVERYNRELKAYIKRFNGGCAVTREDLVREATFYIQFRHLDWDQAVGCLIKADFERLWGLCEL